MLKILKVNDKDRDREDEGVKLRRKEVNKAQIQKRDKAKSNGRDMKNGRLCQTMMKNAKKKERVPK